jgi:hypothetical protein
MLRLGHSCSIYSGRCGTIRDTRRMTVGENWSLPVSLLVFLGAGVAIAIGGVRREVMISAVTAAQLDYR